MRRIPATPHRTSALIALLALSLAGATGCAHRSDRPAADMTTETYPHSIILLIGDGMGLSHVTASQVAEGYLNLERFRIGGFCTTHADDALVTDSAASGTALATGHKSYCGAISVDTSRRPIKTSFEYAEERGKATGLAVTCAITHATPAVFVSHVDDRGKYFDIAEQIAFGETDVLFGGGWAYFVPKSEPGGARTDGRNLIAELERRMPVVRTPAEFRALGDVAEAAGFFTPEHPGVAATRDPDLAELTAKAIEILSRDEDGFFLMVEGSQIDWAGHENDQEYLLAEMRDFDDAVGVALDFAERDERTLVLVTADHECGGFALTGGSMEKGTVASRFATDSHTATMVPVFAFGPGAEVFGGIRDNTFLGRTFINYVDSP